VAKMGHIPVVGVNLALPIISSGELADPYGAIMRISLAIAERCDAILHLGLSPGVERELAVFHRKGLPIYKDLCELPPAK